MRRLDRVGSNFQIKFDMNPLAMIGIHAVHKRVDRPLLAKSIDQLTRPDRLWIAVDLNIIGLISYRSS